MSENVIQAEGHLPMEEMEVFRRYVELADWAWNIIAKWKPLAQDTVGKQLIRAIDSVGANLVEGDGRHGTADALHFFVIARASAREARYWLRRAATRGLIEQASANEKINELASATQLLNRLISYRPNRARQANFVKETGPSYATGQADPCHPTD
jgi:four helix bundle protein